MTHTSGRGGGGPIFGFIFFFSLFLRDYRNCGGGEGYLRSVNQESTIDEGQLHKNGTLGLAQNQSDEIVTYHISGI